MKFIKILCAFSMILFTSACEPKADKHMVYEPIQKRCFVTSYIHFYNDGTIDISPTSDKFIIPSSYVHDVSNSSDINKYKKIIGIAENNECIDLDEYDIQQGD